MGLLKPEKYCLLKRNEMSSKEDALEWVELSPASASDMTCEVKQMQIKCVNSLKTSLSTLESQQKAFVSFYNYMKKA